MKRLLLNSLIFCTASAALAQDEAPVEKGGYLFEPALAEWIADMDFAPKFVEDLSQEAHIAIGGEALFVYFENAGWIVGDNAAMHLELRNPGPDGVYGVRNVVCLNYKEQRVMLDVVDPLAHTRDAQSTPAYAVEVRKEICEKPFYYMADPDSVLTALHDIKNGVYVRADCP